MVKQCRYGLGVLDERALPHLSTGAHAEETRA